MVDFPIHITVISIESILKLTWNIFIETLSYNLPVDEHDTMCLRLKYSRHNMISPRWSSGYTPGASTIPRSPEYICIWDSILVPLHRQASSVD